jgi:Ca-activated chloride channel family protein
MSFSRPEFLLLLLLAIPEILTAKLRTRGLRRSFELVSGPRRRKRNGLVFAISSWYALAFSILCLASLALAMAGPSWGRKRSAAERSGIELAVVLDVSRSMLAEDCSPTRLDEAKAMIRSLVAAAAERRDSPSSDGASFAMSLVAAKGGALLLVPMTEDDEAFDSALEYADSEVMTSAGTELEAAIDAALASFTERGSGSRLMVLFTDGGELSGSARRAAARLREENLRLIAVGMGGADPLPLAGRDGLPILDRAGRPVLSALEEPALRAIAAAAEGRYLRGSDSGTAAALLSELSSASSAGTKLEYGSVDRTAFFALAAFICLLLALLTETIAQKGGAP